MQYFTADMFVDALILLLHNRTDHTLQMVSALLEIYEAETKNSTYIENETFSFYVFLLHEIISRKITINDTAEIEAFLLKFKANSFVTSDPELYTALRTIFTDKNEIKSIFEEGIREIRALESECLCYQKYFIENKEIVNRKVDSIVRMR